MRGKILILTVLIAKVQTIRCLDAILRGTLPRSIYGLSACYRHDDKSIIILGGYSWDRPPAVHTETYKFDLVTSNLSVLGNFPYAEQGIGYGGIGMTNSDASHLYYFGGDIFNGTEDNFDGKGYINSDAIFKYDVNNPNLKSVIVGHLPLPLNAHAIGWDGGNKTYIAGGWASGFQTKTIHEYDATSGKTTQVGEFPEYITEATGAYASGAFYIFGGGFDENRDWIYKFENGALEVIGETPSLYAASAVTVGTDIYVLGGNSMGVNKLVVYRFSTLSREVQQLHVANVNHDISRAAAVYVKSTNAIYIIGGIKGYGGINRYLDTIYSISLN